MISYVIDNEEEAEFIYHKERVKYEKSVLLGQLLENNKKRWSSLTVFQMVTGERLLLMPTPISIMEVGTILIKVILKFNKNLFHLYL